MNEEREYPFEFSVVMAVYNVELFLREAVDSLIQQDFGFEKIQLIMVDDGSTDGSGVICDAYAEQYPGNVVVIHKENGGVSSARNEGLKHVSGRYVNFMDSDDKLEFHTMTAVHEFFEQHEAETDVVAIPLIFFDGKTGEHMLNYKFNKGSRVIDLLKEYSMIQMHIASSFLRYEVVQSLSFDERLAFAEDAACMLKVLLEKCTLGVVKKRGSAYLYRQRTVGQQSAIQRSAFDKRWYLPPQQYFWKESIQYCLNKYGHVKRFVQFTLAYDLQWKIKLEHIPIGILEPGEEEQFRIDLVSVLQYIDDDIILQQKNIYIEYKLYMLKKKHGKMPELVERWNDLLLCFGNTVMFRLSRTPTSFEFWEIRDGQCTIEGYTTLFSIFNQEADLWLEVNGQMWRCERVDRYEVRYALSESIMRHHGFKVSFPVSRCDRYYGIRFFVMLDGKLIQNRNFRYKKFFPIGNKYKGAYCIEDDWRLSGTTTEIRITSCGRRGHIESEIAFCRELWKKNELGGRKAVFARAAYHLIKLFKRKPIWLISDRIIRADDNGEAFFRYMRENHREIRTYFVLNKDCADYPRMKKIGPVVNNLSWKHKLLFMLCDYNISSQADAITSNPFPGYEHGVKDILSRERFIFLQHGITKDDISGWLNRYSKNFYGFITAAVPEHTSILEGNYYYSEKEVWNTGFPRFDRLYHDEKRYITVMPTWRKYLMQRFDNQTGIWSLTPGFGESAFCTFYRNLLNHSGLLAAADRLGYQLCFLPHPTLQPYLSMFEIGNAVEVLGLDAKYREIYAQSNLVVTDYSSACFDFAYLRKPIVYCQFDAEQFFEGEHVYTKGYFDYERDGFGEVEYDLESTVDRIIEYMESGCQLKDKYRARVDQFFAYNDQNNCQRVYEKIMELEEKT